MAKFTPPTSVSPPPTRKPSDIHTLSSISSFRPLHLHLEWDVNWDKKLISGSVEHTIRTLKSGEKQLRLDSSYLDVSSVTSHGHKLEFTVEPRKNSLGSPLVITLPQPSQEGEEFNVHIKYSTTADCTALGWLSAEQTAAKTAPFLYSQCQAIHCRSLVPLFDSPWWKVTYTATVKSQYPILMSALPVDPKDHKRFLDPVTPDEAIANPREIRTYGFSQKVSIPSYLIAIVAGHLAFAPLGPRTGLWAEKPDLARCKWEFETNAENYLKALEDIVSPYSWTRYDSVVLPPSFPYGGMENANMTTLTPTLIVGDRSQCDVLLHELSHSWSGNLTSCGDWSSFWLNEGINVWLERLALQYVHGPEEGPAHRGFSYIIGAKALLDARKQNEDNPRFQRLVPVFTEGEDPDDAFSSIPYEAGSNLILHLERTVGGLDIFLPFIKSYFKTFYNRSVTTQDFIDHLYSFYESSHEITADLNKVDWKAWLHGEGLALPVKMTYNDSLAQESYALAKRWSDVIKSSEAPKSGDFSVKDIESFDTDQLIVFMERLHEDSSLKFLDKYAKHMDEVYRFTSDKGANGEVMLRFFELALEDKESSFIKAAAEWVSRQGRMKYNRPIFRSLSKTAPELAKKTFLENKGFYHPIAASMIQKTLGLRHEPCTSIEQSHEVIAVIGSTGTGKSQLGVEIAEYIASASASSSQKYVSASVISADSMQIYHGLDVITNKADVSEMAAVPHHLMSFLPVGEEYDVGRFCHDAKRLGEGMLKQRDLPLIVGGTTYYVQHLLFPGKVVTARLAEGRGGDVEHGDANVIISPANEELMQRIKTLPPQEAATWEAVIATSRNTLPGVPPLHLWQLLDKLDPDMAKRWHPQDSRKISNSLRVVADTGRPHSDWIREQEEGGKGTEEDSSGSPSPSQWADRPLRILLIWVWAFRDDLYLRLDKRVEKMIPAGLLREICELRGIAERMKTDEGRDETDYTRGIFQAIGYKEFKPFLDALDAAGVSGVDVDVGALSPDLEALFERGLQGMMTATRQYAKKQVAWMKNKLLPEVRKRRERGEEVEVILLDTTDVEKWQDNVKTPALEAVRMFLAGERLPASVHTEASVRELLPLLKEPEAKPAASAAADAGPSSLSTNAYKMCEVCTHSREDKASAPVYYRQADERHHTTSKGHRHALNRLRNKERLESEGTLADASDAALQKAEQRAAKRAKASHPKAEQEETGGANSRTSVPQDQAGLPYGTTTSTSGSSMAGNLRRRGEEEHTPVHLGGERNDLPAIPSDFTQRTLERLPASHERTRASPLLFLVVFHLLLACLTLTFFQPDEFWQSQEVAHRLSFGYGYLTWEWRHPGPAESWLDLLTQHSPSRGIWDYLEGGPVRSVLYPLMFVPCYLSLKATGLDQYFTLLTLAPRLVQALLSAVAAHHTYMIADQLIVGPAVGYATLFSLLTSPYYLYTATRTFSNTAEASLSNIALYHWFKSTHSANGRHSLALSLAALACLIRPTNAVLWICLFAEEMLRSSRANPTASEKKMGRPAKERFSLFLIAIVIGFMSLLLTALLDSWFHQRPTLPLIPFLNQNVFQSISLFYGANPWHWYLSQGLPIVGMTALPSIILGGRQLWLQGGVGASLVRLTIWTIAVYSCLGHKEWRFLQPVVALLHTMAGKHLATPAPTGPPQTPIPATSASTGVSTRRKSTLSNLLAASTTHRKLFLLHLCTLPLAIYLLLFHCVGQSFTLPRYLRAAHAKGELKSVGFLMPCHSTPWQSHLHLAALDGEAGGAEGQDRLWFVSCEPPRDHGSASGGGGDTYRDESDYFYADPLRYLRLYLPAQVDESFASTPAVGEWDSQLHGGMWDSRLGSSSSSSSSGDVGYEMSAGAAVAAAAAPLHQWPSHLITFEALLTSSVSSIVDTDTRQDVSVSVETELRLRGYTVEARLWNSLFHDDPRRRGRIVIWRWTRGGEDFVDELS